MTPLASPDNILTFSPYNLPPDLAQPCYADDDSRWKAVAGRDAGADGAFVYCVRTTKIYCRPVCKSRLARRSNVVFFSTGHEAARAGFRACKRCKPDAGARMPDELATAKIHRYIQDSTANLLKLQQQQQLRTGDGGAGGGGRIDDRGDERTEAPKKPETLESMSRRVGLSKWHFHRVFKSITGMTPAEYTALYRKLSTEAEKQAGQTGDVGAGEGFDAFLWNEDLFAPEHNLPTPSISEPTSLETAAAAVVSSADWSGMGLEQDRQEDLLDWMDMDMPNMVK